MRRALDRMRRAVAVALLLALAACGRPLTETEAEFATRLHGAALDLGKVRLARGNLAGAVTFRYKARPRLSCRERILPPPRTETITARPAAVTLFNTIRFTDDWYLDDYAPGYPERLHLLEAMLLAHELTHVWQWQNRARTGYHPLLAAAEHGHGTDPYLFDLDGPVDFLAYGYEQQGAIVEEYVCCRALAPQAARTQRLHRMLSGAFPVSELPRRGRESDVYLPWKGAEIAGICD